jgi:hypothetical protein
MIIALLFNVCGAYIVFESVKSNIRSSIKQKIKEGVPASELTILRFSSQEVEAGTAGIEWIEGHEFRYHKAMYDVVRTEKDGGDLVYYCINDTQEESLFARLGALVNATTAHDKNCQQKTHHLLQLIIHEAIQDAVLVNQEPSSFDIHRISLQEFTQQTYIEIPTPPPHQHA